MKKIFILILFLSFNRHYSQGTSQVEASFQSPNAAAMGRFGEIPVSLFTGSPNISIPLTKIKNGSIEVSLDLNYDAGGCRLDEHPTWVGLNWNLNSGGVIRRQANGQFDEHVQYDSTRPSFLESKALLNSSNWNTLTYLQQLNYESAPDEFNFTVNGLSGSLIMDHSGNWVVRSRDNIHLKVEHLLVADYPVQIGSSTYQLPKAYTRFTLTAPDGTVYIFGDHPNALEYSYSPQPSMIEPYNNDPMYLIDPPISGNANWFREIQISAWYLTKIISPSGSVVTFNYDRGRIFQQNIYSQISKDGWRNLFRLTTGDINQAHKAFISSSILSSIVTNNNIVCSFIRSESQELQYIFKPKPASIDGWGHFPIGGFYKLDKIEVRDNGTLVKNIALSYIEKATERLKLKRVKFLSNTDGQPKYEFGIEYNPDLLPIYNTGEEDHWGFYNGKNFWPGVSTQSNIGQATSLMFNLDDYYASREPDANLMDAEIIRRITYPSGGFTEFEFEPHQYSKVVEYNPNIRVQQLDSAKIAGGLRIRKISNYESINANPVSKEYYYSTNYINNGTLSSGVLSARPVYYEELTLPSGQKYTKFSSNPLNHMNTTNGNHVTYSEVTEKVGEGFIVYKYTNHDNGYLDKAPFAKIAVQTIASSVQQKIFGKLNLERGLLLRQQIYSASKVLLKEDINTYNSNPNRYNQYVRSINAGINIAEAQINLSAIPIYTFHPFLASRNTIDYFPDGTSLTESKSFSYDPNYRYTRTELSQTSEGSFKKVFYNYPPDFTYLPGLDPNSELYDITSMANNHIINIPVERIEILAKDGGEYVVGGVLNQFENLKLEKIFELNLNRPIPIIEFNSASVSGSNFVFDSRYKESTHFSKYDDKGHVLEVIPFKGPVVSYLWGYGKNYPVAKIVNANQATIANVVGASNINTLANSYDSTQIQGIINSIRTGLPTAMITTYLYSPSVGLTTEIRPDNSKTTFEFDDLGRLIRNKDNEGKLISSVEYGYDKYKRIAVNPPSIVLGSLVTGETMSKTVKIYNTGNLPVTISGITIAAPLTYSLSSNVIEPDSSVDLTITASSGTVQFVNQDIIISSDAENNNSLNVQANITGTRVISLSGNLNFGTLYPQQQIYYPISYKTFTITNLGTGTLTVYQVGGAHGITTTGGTGQYLPGESKSVIVKFAPVVPGNYGGIITVNSDKSSGINTISTTGEAASN